ncbi:hypothetical protein M5K25_005852 [Dendrobium thyrsiflorum]|uniref:Uncharacterized protein n=1 Tax=Dendrobium thyrsiflorum TaxID=117978 RepID=A0ABD0VGX1_DENTH
MKVVTVRLCSLDDVPFWSDRFEAIGEHMSSDHDRNLVLPFGDESTGDSSTMVKSLVPFTEVASTSFKLSLFLSEVEETSLSLEETSLQELL